MTDLPSPPAEAIDAAERAAALGQGSTDPLSVAGVEVQAALRGQRPLERRHVVAMAAHTYDTESLNGLLFGGAPGRAWSTEVLAAAAEPEQPQVDLDALSRRLAEVDARFRDRVEQVLAQAMRAALRRADVKIKVRSRSRVVTAAAVAPHFDDMLQRAYPPPLLAALRTTTDELLDQSFEDAADQAVLLFARRQRDRRRVLAAELDLDPADLEAQWQGEDERRSGAVRNFVVGAMFGEAAARLSQPRDAPLFDPRGEAPVDPFVSPRITADVARLADGARDGVGDQATQGLGRQEGGRLFDYSDQLVDDLVAQRVDGRVVKVYTWTVGGSDRPFEPHQQLAGLEATDDTTGTVFAKDPGEFPEGETEWYPGDHPGCVCDLQVRYEAQGGPEQ